MTIRYHAARVGSPLAIAVAFAALFTATGGAACAGEEESGRAAHEVLLERLRNSSAVIPPEPPVHPYRALYNREAVIPPQCYTRTEGRFNPCYVCHQDEAPGRENRMNDRELQIAYSFSDIGQANHWQNLFEDRSARVAAISDEAILAWVNQDNYSQLSKRLRAARFEGWTPDLANLQQGRAAFDRLGFARDGSHWVAFNYKPLPSAFWPTNGSTDDVMIRLSEVYRSRADGTYSRDVYLANLAIVEASIKGFTELDTPPIDEREVGIDLDGDGTLAVATVLSRASGYVGAASRHFFEQGIYPMDTEFLHTVRYVGFDADGGITLSTRMKEVRYMRKRYALPKFALAQGYTEEHWDKEQGRLPGYIDRGQPGLDNEMGWLVQGFIEDSRGELRASTYEENMFCMGCHTSVGATIDKTFSFPRKIDGAAGWGYIDLRGMPDAPNVGETKGEFATYFERAGSSEFRNNDEIAARFFDADGSVDANRIAAAADVYELVTPSRERALLLNKAYRAIVEDQDFIHGRDATVKPPANVYERIDNATTPTLPTGYAHTWDIRLDWRAVTRRRADDIPPSLTKQP
jgi:hypothetical protein